MTRLLTELTHVQLATRQPESQIVVVDRSLARLLGSTGHAPGFVGQLNSIPTLTELAKRSVAHYNTIEGGFQVVGGVEVAETEEAVEVLKERLQLAKAAKLEGRIITAEDAKKLSPTFIDEAKTKAALFFPTDGTARADILTATARKEAERLGALFLEADVTEVRIQDGITEGIETSSGFVSASQVIITTGIWASQTLQHLPVLPVAHPYIHSLPRSPLPGPPSPFIRWPASHVYARDHGDCSGLGSYDHPPIAEDKLGIEAIGSWRPDFARVLDVAYERLPEESRAMFEGGKAFNGIFSTTPDNLPLIGKVSEGLYACVAVWVTHAAASAEVLAGQAREGDEELLKALNPQRFSGRNADELRKRSLRAYNDIYNRGDE
jgi:glycine/D-amino acid oxidase-like deaminating enzyme